MSAQPFSAQPARDPLHDVGHDLRIDDAARDVIEEEERLGALDEDVVHAVVHEILADRVVLLREKGDLELRPDAVDARNEHGALEPSRHLEEAAEISDLRKHFLPPRPPRQRGDLLLRPVRGVDIDARFLVFRACHSLLHAAGSRPIKPARARRGSCRSRSWRPPRR